jgi:hypothetical protein
MIIRRPIMLKTNTDKLIMMSIRGKVINPNANTAKFRSSFLYSLSYA